ncbi:MAG TPA: phosphatidylserine/phosphatidylglycerophosphate/cardiolipin synthase family protein, partial [Luteolibacter sp.]
MSRRPLCHFLALGTAGFSLLCASCTSFEKNARRSSEIREQANPLPVAGGSIALMILRSTAVATVKQPVTTLRTGGALALNRTRELIRSNIPLDGISRELPPYAPGSAEFERALEREGCRIVGKGTIRPLVDGREFFPAYLAEVKKAARSVDTQLYIFDNDDTSVRCADLLRARSNDVRVRVLFDDMGTTMAHVAAPETPAPRGFNPPADIGEYLSEGSKVRVRRKLNPWLVSDHSKLIVIDQKRAFLGGMNIGREYESEWHDLMVQVDGPVVTQLQRQFNRAWRKAGPGGDLALFRSPRRPPLSAGAGIPLRILRTDPAEGTYEVLKAFRLAIRASKKRVWIENPYFSNDDIADELIAAARRGVDVRVILPTRGDSGLMEAGNRATAQSLMAAGAKVLRYPGMTHMKIMICDGWATLGSANLDVLSLRIN